MSKAILRLLFVCIAQTVMAWLLYRSRAVAHLGWADSDFVVFGLPLALGFVFSALVLWTSGSSKRSMALFGIAAVCALVSSFVGTLVGFNQYGT